MCVFHQESYITLLKLLITSISVKANIKKETTDILIITSKSFQPLIQKELEAFNLPLHYYILDLYTLMESSCCKLKIFQYNEIDKYQKILYLDTDVLINSDVNVLFDIEISSEKLHALEEGNIGHDYNYWGKQFFDFTKFNSNSPAFSAGVFYFMNSLSIKKLFEDTNAHIATYLIENKPIPVCLDQPFLVYNSFIQDKYENQFMKKYLENNPSIVNYEKIIYHFPGGPGHYASKYEKMTSFWEKMKYNIFDTILSNNFTMVSKERLTNLYKQCDKFRNTNYSFVECGVAKGGCLALMAHIGGETNRIYGFDSFEGMPNITEKDLDNHNNPKVYVGNNLSGGIENVYKTFKTLNINMKNVNLIKGFFKDTMNVQENIENIGEICVLRLDGDWYESNMICFDKLYDKVIVGGIIIIDDYGHWVGAKRATDEFRNKHNILTPLIQTDYTEYYWVKEEQNYSELCILGQKYNVDKSPFFGNHTYTPEYHKLLKDIRNNVDKVLEIGIGNIPLMSGLTHSSYKPGASLRMWRDYFPKANIIGCDILKDVLFNEERISTFLTDQSNIISLNNLMTSIGNNIDLIIDDGSHIQEHMVTSFITLWKNIKYNGIYIIEDIHISFFDRIMKLNDEFNLFDAKCIMAYKGKFVSDNFVVFKKLHIFDTRNEMLKYYCDKLSNPKILEIGVFKGELLDYLVKNCNLKSIDAVDLFEGVTCSGNADGNDVVYYDVGKSYLELLEKYKDTPNINIHKSNSINFLQNQEDNSYDIIYIDGDHSYNGVKNDLFNAYRTIKNGGYIMGHDYEMNMKKTKNIYNFGVQQAVDEFCIKYNQTIEAKALDGCVSYCINIKNNKFICI